MLDLHQYQAIIFDMDGTLVDSMPAHLEAWRLAAQAHGFTYDPDWLGRLGGMPSVKIVELMNQQQSLSLDPNAVSMTKSKHFDALRHQCQLIPETAAVLRHYQGKLKIAIGTGSQRRNAIALLTNHQLLDTIDIIVSANDVCEHKPHPATFLKAASQLGVSPEQCIVFEDTELGFEAAHRAGMALVKVDGSGSLTIDSPMDI